MRVYEIARELGLPASEVMERLGARGIVVKGHMSLISDEAIAFLRAPVQDDVQPASFVPRSMPLDKLAVLLNKKASELIILLLGWKLPTTKNQMVPVELVERIAVHYEVPIAKLVEGGVVKNKDFSSASDIAAGRERAPVVVILGHVDHGKTTLLDFIRKSHLAAAETGGITQHVGAYEVAVPYEGKSKGVVFLDTPGHAAFAKMRQRGVAAADIAIILIAVDDGVMPQTIEAIKAARSVDMPIIVALNKVDRVNEARIDQVKQGLARYDLLIEEWGGEIICVPLSAKTGQGVDTLLEMILLRSQVMDLRAIEGGEARGYVLEAKMERGRGIVATVILRHGSLSIGDRFISGNTFGSVTSLISSHGVRLKKAFPSTPVLVAGFQEFPQPGDMFKSISGQEYKDLRPTRKSASRTGVAARSFVAGACNIILKADTNMSLEALSDALFRIGDNAENFNVVSSSIGSVSEGDVHLAANTGAIIVGLHVKADAAIRALAKQQEVSLYLHDIIYRLLEELEKEVLKKSVAESDGVSIGKATVLLVFNIKNVGVIAGSRVDEGRFISTGTVVAWRGDKQIGKGKITSLQRERKTVKEVHEGFECGFVVEGFEGWKPGDKAECFMAAIPVSE